MWIECALDWIDNGYKGFKQIRILERSTLEVFFFKNNDVSISVRRPCLRVGIDSSKGNRILGIYATICIVAMVSTKSICSHQAYDALYIGHGQQKSRNLIFLFIPSGFCGTTWL